MKNYLVILSAVALLACRNTQEHYQINAVQHDTLISDTTAQTRTDTIIQDGEYLQHYANGVIQLQGIMSGGKRDGVWKSFYGNGNPWSETTFSVGVKNGKTITWYENGLKRYEGYYKDDKEYSNWTFWDEKGNLVESKNY